MGTGSDLVGVTLNASREKVKPSSVHVLNGRVKLPNAHVSVYPISERRLIHVTPRIRKQSFRSWLLHLLIFAQMSPHFAASRSALELRDAAARAIDRCCCLAPLLASKPTAVGVRVAREGRSSGWW